MFFDSIDSLIVKSVLLYFEEAQYIPVWLSEPLTKPTLDADEVDKREDAGIKSTQQGGSYQVYVQVDGPVSWCDRHNGVEQS